MKFILYKDHASYNYPIIALSNIHVFKIKMKMFFLKLDNFCIFLKIL